MHNIKPTFSEINNFFSLLWPMAEEGYLTLCAIRDKKYTQTKYFRVDDLEKVAKEAASMAGGQDVYYTTGLLKSRPKKGRGKESDVKAIPGLFMDIDHKGGVHAEKNLPSIDEALSFIKEMPFMPSLIVNSGGGLHVYWLFKEAWHFENEAEREEAKRLLVRFQSTIIYRAREKGWRLDNTADLVRLLRIPGTFNFKSDPVEVKIIESNDFHYDPDSFDDFLIDAPLPEVSKTSTGSAGNKRLHEIIDRCAFLKHCKNGAESLPEPDWWAMVCVLCGQYGSKPVIHELSKNYPNYSAKETNDKILEAMDTTGPMTCKTIREKTGFQGCPKDGCGLTSPVSEKKKAGKPTIADSLVLLAKENVHSFFNDQLDTAHARFPTKDHFEHWPIRSKSFRTWLQGLYYKATKGKGAKSDAVSQALDTLEAIAKFEGKGEIDLHVRVCERDGAYWYDLSNEQWQAVKITETGWQVIDKPPVLFRRLAHQKPQAMPDRNGTVAALHPFLEGIEKPEHKNLVTVWLISGLIPDFSHTILVPYGGQGSGKTTLSKNCKAIIDPSLIDTLGLVGEQRELVQTLSHHWSLAYDNLSSLSREVQNIFCRAVTGSSYSKRKLYSDDDDVITKNRVCLIISGINYPATAPDLLDRCILIKLKRFSNSGRNKKDAVLDKEFQAALPAILGAMFNVLSEAMQIKSEVNLNKLPRMADFTEWGFAIAEVAGFCGQKFLTTYQENTNLRNQEIISANPVASAMMAFMKDKAKWEGTSSELLNELEPLISERDRKARAWPKSSNVLTRRLNELKTNLDEAGIRFEIGHSGERFIKITACPKVKENIVHTVQPSKGQQNQGCTADGMLDGTVRYQKYRPSTVQPKPLESLSLDDMDGMDDKITTLHDGHDGGVSKENKKNDIPDDVEITKDAVLI